MTNHQTKHSALSTQHSLTAIILAAGESRRMGALGAKQMLPWRAGRTMLQAVIDSLATAALPLQEAIVVLGCRAGEIVTTLSREQWPDLPLRVVVNENWPSGMLGSVQRGLIMTAPAAGYLILLGDQPDLAPATIHAVAATFSADPMRPTLPTVADVEGHPLILPSVLRDKILAAGVDTPGGLRALLGDDIQRITLSDDAAIKDIDTAADYDEHLHL
jgi:CTP:molybdopterin cytidylyltransferase MocA